MSCSKPLPPFVCDSLDYLNRDQLERFLIVSRSLKNFIERYFHSKPYRVFYELRIRGALYVLIHERQYKSVQWHPNREDYSAQQFLAMQNCSVDTWRYSKCGPLNHLIKYYSFDEMRPYLSSAVRIKRTIIYAAEDSTYNAELVAEMESLTHLWRDGQISISSYTKWYSPIVVEDFQLILNSPTILQCRELAMTNADFPVKDFNILYTVKVIKIFFHTENYAIDPKYWLDFLEQPGVKPIVALHELRHESINNLLNRFSKAFSNAVSPNAFKIAFLHCVKQKESLPEFRKTNNTSGDKLEFKKGLPAEYENQDFKRYDTYTLERSSI